MRQLIPAIGFPWTMRVIALIQLVTLSVSNIGLRPKTKTTKTTGWVDWSAFRDSRYIYFALATFANSLNLLLIFNGVNALGRLGFSFAADKFGALSVFVPEACATTITCFTWIVVKTAPGLYTWTVFCGMFSGGVQTLFPAGLGYLTADTENPGARIGMVFGIVSVACLVGSPIGGALIGAMNGSYLGAQIFGGATMGLAAVFLEATRRLDNRKSNTPKA
ncbi:hypothetical protein ACHAPJ_006651 [Fusarium lateritium]